MLKIEIKKRKCLLVSNREKFESFAYIRMVKQLKEGDELYIKSIDCLGRDHYEIIEHV